MAPFRALKSKNPARAPLQAANLPPGPARDPRTAPPDGTPAAPRAHIIGRPGGKVHPLSATAGPRAPDSPVGRVASTRSGVSIGWCPPGPSTHGLPPMSQTSLAAPATAPAARLERVLGPWMATALVVGTVIGSGVFKK